MSNIISIIVSVVSIAAFVLVVQPQYGKIKEMQTKDAELQTVLDNARKLQSIRDSLLEKRKSISESDVRRLEKLIPESADNVKLILEFQQVASRSNLSIQAASATKSEEDEGQVANQQFDVETNDYGIITLDFTLEGEYSNFVSFLEEIEKNLRITDIRSLSIAPNTEDPSAYTYTMSIDTYWLKDNI